MVNGGMHPYNQCSKCGAQVASGMRFCGNCGSQLNWPTQQQIQQSLFKRHQSGFSREINVSAYIEYVCPHCGGCTAFTWEFGVLETEKGYFLIPSELPYKLPIITLFEDARGNLTLKDICYMEGNKLLSITSIGRSLLVHLSPCGHCSSEIAFICGIGTVISAQGELLFMPSGESQNVRRLPVVILMDDGKGNLSVKGIY